MLSFKEISTRLFHALVFLIGMLAVSCVSAKEERFSFPPDFHLLEDSQKIMILKESLSADSLAVYLCDIALGTYSNIVIDDFKLALIDAYMSLPKGQKEEFMETLNTYVGSLEIADKAKIYYDLSQESPRRLGELMKRNMHENPEKTEDILNEIELIKNLAASDSIYLQRFKRGLN